MPTVTVAKPVVASALGVIVLGETLDANGPEIFVLIAAVVMVLVATVALARGEAATMAAGAGRDVRRTDQPTVPSDVSLATMQAGQPAEDVGQSAEAG